VKNFLLLFLFSGYIFSQDLFDDAKKRDSLDLQPYDVIHWNTYDCRSYQNGYIEVEVDLFSEQDFRIYADKLNFYNNSGWFYVGSKPPKARKVIDPISKSSVNVYDKGRFSLLFKGPQAYLEDRFSFNIKYLGCTKKICLFPYVESLQVNNFIVEKNLPPQAVAKFIKNSPPREVAKSQQVAKSFDFGASYSFGWLLLLALLGGLLTNLTPCIYPMIPITVRLLARESSRPMLGASLYGLGIMSTYTSLGAIAVFTGGVFGALMANSFFNLFLSVLMFVLGFGMLGFFNFFYLQQLGEKIGNKKSGLLRTFFMGIGAGLIASPCTGPILASLLTYVATLDNSSQSILILLIYSFGFSLPYVVLARMSSSLTKIKVKSWVANTIKNGFAGIIFALGFYYLRIPLYGFYKSLIDYWMFISIGSLLLAGVFFCFYFYKFYQRLTLSLFAVFLGLNLLSYYQWYNISSSKDSRSLLPWHTNETSALMEAHNSKSSVLIDMWAEWCESCKQMDSQVFSNPKVVQKLLEKKWILLKADLTKISSPESISFKERYKIKGLPTLVIIRPGEDPFLLKGFVSAENLLKIL
jgi:thioredoxin:protein disulfide reductase